MVKTTVNRTVNFNLYTDRDLSDEEGNITVSIQIMNGDKYLLDSTVATIPVKDIPKQANKLVIPKVLPYADNDLKIGFKYVIRKADVGYSLHYDFLGRNELHKEFNFAYK